jgi:hypothetical protein
MEEALELVKPEFAAIRTRGYAHPYRIYVSNIGHDSQIALEWEFQTLAEFEEFWSSWQPEDPEFVEKWYGLQRGDIGVEVWGLVD